MAPSVSKLYKKLFAGGGLLFAGLVIELGVSFVAKAVIARVLGPVNYGAVSLGVTTLGLLSTLALLGLHTGIGRYLPRFDDVADRRGVIISAFQVVVPVSTAVGILVVIFANPIATYVFTDLSTAVYIRIFGLAIPFTAIMKLSTGVIQGLQQTAPKVIVQNVTPPVTRFSAVVVAVIVGAGSIGIASAYAISYVAAALVGLYYVFTRTEILSNVKPTHMHGELLSFSVPLIVSAAISFILTDLDTFMLGYFASTRDVGVYNVVYPLAQLLTTGLTAFGFLFMPIISELDAEGSTDEIHRIYQTITKWIFMGTLPVFLVVALFPDMTIQITFGSEYMEGGVALTLLSIAYFTHAITGPNANTLTSIGRTRLIMWDNLAIGILNALLNLALIPEYGYLGAGVATAVSYATLNLLYSAQLYRETGIHPFTTALAYPGLIATILVALIYWVTTNYLTVTIPVLVVMFILFMILYAVIILRFGGVEEEEIALVLSFEERFDLDLGPLKEIAERLIR